MWYTENAFVMNKVRAEAFYVKLKEGGDGWALPLQGEWAVTPDISLWALVSYNVFNLAEAERRDGIGDSELLVKWAPVNRESAVLSLVGGALIPPPRTRT